MEVTTTESLEPITKKQRIDSNETRKVKLQKFTETEEEAQTRFLAELEFVQCLANPYYLHFLAQNRYFQEERFLNYLKYLDEYWRNPAYSKFLVFPHCLKMLELLQHDNFRKALNNIRFADFIHAQQFYHWQFYRNNRLYPPSSSQNAIPSLSSNPASTASHQ